ncbi:hypothetical protein GMSM_14040 [Geomonas sp. Red276]
MFNLCTKGRAREGAQAKKGWGAAAPHPFSLHRTRDYSSMETPETFFVSATNFP